MKKILLLLISFLAPFSVSLAQEHRTVIISLDGCRWDYPEMYDTPFLDNLAQDGVKAIMQLRFHLLRYLTIIRWQRAWFLIIMEL